MEKPPLDLEKLHESFLPYRLLLAASAALGTFLGILVIAIGAFAAAMATPLALAALLVAIAGVSASSAHLLVIGLGAIIMIPLGALLATSWRLQGIENVIVRDFRAQPPPKGTKMHEVLSLLATRAGLKETPRYGVLEEEFNAFAMSSGTSVGMVLLGRPLAEKLAPSETLAVLGHEIGHIAMRDTERKFLMISHQEFLTSFLFLAGLKRFARSAFGLIGELALAAHSRQREYWADAVGAYVTTPEMMIAALRAIDEGPPPTKAERQYAALMFRPVTRLFTTHPSTDERIDALQRGTYINLLPTRRPEEMSAAPPPEPASYRGI